MPSTSSRPGVVTRQDWSNHRNISSPSPEFNDMFIPGGSEFPMGMFQTPPASQPREEDDIIDKMLDAGVAKLHQGIVGFSRAFSGVCFGEDNRHDALAEEGLAGALIDFQNPSTYPGVTRADRFSHLRRRRNAQ